MRPQLDRDKVLTEGKAVTGKLLIELQVRKSTADGEGAKAFYTELTKPPPEWEGEIRDLVLKKKLVSTLSVILFVLTEGSPAAPKDLHPTQYFYRE
jgi:dipeptidyl-peptidase-3